MPVTRSAGRDAAQSESPKRAGLRRRAAQGAFYSQYFAEGELSEDDEGDTIEVRPRSPPAPPPVRLTRSGRRMTSYAEPEWDEEEEEEEEEPRARSTRRTRSVSKSLRDFVAPDDEEEDENADYGETMRARRAQERQNRRENLMNLAASRSARRRQVAHSSESSPLLDTSPRHTKQTDAPSSDDTPSSASEPEAGTSGRAYSFRTRKKINYSQVAPPPEPLRDGFGRRVRRTRSSRTHALPPEPQADGVLTALPSLPYSSLPRRARAQEGWNGLPLSMSGKDYAHAFGEPDDSSDDEPPRTLGATHLAGSGALMESGPAPAPAPGATPAALGTAADALGRVKRDGDPLADVDPLGVDMHIDFDQVGGLEGHVQQLKEMVSLPLLYPELFQRFGVTPPRGVLFHGPPGTGKTLVARALAASCASSGQSISFFMRKGADCLSKWVGEAERQLRLLFEEAKNAQPSIIFFDEIDGLAPVRSSKQDQIHASIVSTLLALMDGMDGRGQVVVIGATNRPDSIDPALRRPGRFDREFYFPLPSKAARRSILSIHTRTWDPPLDAGLQDVLAECTNGFGGADLRALCTEATLNAIQRRYPQIYATTERLQLDPASIQVGGRDFLLALEKLVPSSARATYTAAAPLPPHLTPLLGDVLERAYALCRRLLPPKNPRSALEEAQWEVDPAAGCVPAPDDAPPARALERELMQQSFQKACVYRPRLLLHGEEGMGQAAVAAALLHRLEGYAVQTIAVATLLGDSSQTPEAALVQQFHEARRLKPSILFLPELDRWPMLLAESVRASFHALLDTLRPDEPILLLGVSHVPVWELAPEIRAWFGALAAHRVAIATPPLEARTAFVEEIVRNAARPPTEFADGLPQRRRVLEALPKAPPQPPRKPTQAELSQQVEHDARLLEHLKFRLGPVLAELRKKFKKFTRDVWDEYNLHDLMAQFDWRREKGKVVITLRYDRNEQPVSDSDSEADASPAADTEAEADDAPDTAPLPVSYAPATEAPNQPTASAESSHPTESAAASSAPSPGALGGPPAPTQAAVAATDDNAPYIYRDFTIYTMTLEKMQKRLYYNAYLTCDAFMEDINKMVSNAEEAREVDADRVFRARQMQNLATILLDQYLDAPFRTECERMAQRVLAREEAARQAAAREKAAEVHHKRPNGQRYSARVQGEVPEPQDLVDVGAIERAHKRTRSASAGQYAQEDMAEDAKRTRLDAPPPTGSAASDVPSAPQPLPAEVVQPAETAPAASPAPQPPPGPLVSPDDQRALTATLVRATDGFHVEQLEQLRASCFDAILAHRTTWDRTALLAELHTLAHDLAQAARPGE